MRRFPWILAVSAAAACTSSSPPPASLSQAATFDEAAASAATAVTQYRAAAAASSSQAECIAALGPYVATIEPLLDRMRSMAPEMDGFMTSSGSAASADMACGVQVMADDLSHHQAVACASADMAANHAEAQRHADAMASFTEHMEMRAVQAGGMMSDGGMGQRRMMDGGWMGGWSDGGWTAPDGGMMGFDQPMPACTFTGAGYQGPDGGYMSDGGWVGPPAMMDGGTGPMMDGGTGPMVDGGTGPMMDGGGGMGMERGSTMGGATR